jgi:hypothetical protein
MMAVLQWTLKKRYDLMMDRFACIDSQSFKCDKEEKDEWFVWPARKVVKVGFQKPNHHGERQRPASDKTRQIPRSGQTAIRAH